MRRIHDYFVGLVLALGTHVVGAQVPMVPQTRGLPTGGEFRQAVDAAQTAALIALKDKGDDEAVRAFEMAAKFARDSASGIYEAWRLASAFPDASSSLRENKDIAQASLDKALLSKDAKKLATALDAIKDPDKREHARRDARYLASRLDEILDTFGPSPAIVVFAEGDIRGVATGDSTKSATGTGSLGANLVTRRGIWQANIAIASSVDTVSEGYGNSILAPGTGRSLRSGSLSYHWNTPSRRYLPDKFHLYGSVSSYHWRATSTNSDGSVDTTTTQVSTMGLGALARSEPGCCRVLDNPVLLAIEYGLAARWLNGNISGRRDLRSTLLGTDRSAFVGPELGLQLSFGKATASLAAYYLFGKKGEHVDGLTDLQIIAAFTASSEIFRGPLTR
jgi:hypothetical protein